MQSRVGTSDAATLACHLGRIRTHLADLKLRIGPSNTMSQAKESQSQETVALELNQALDSGSLYEVRQLLKSLPSAGIAHLLESSPPKARNVLWQLIDKDAEGEVLQELNEDLQSEILSELDAQQVVKITEGLETDDQAVAAKCQPDRRFLNLR